MSPLPHPAAHVARTRHLPAFAALVAALLVAACGAAQSSPAGSVAAAGSSDTRPSSSVPTAAPTPSATATPFSRPVTASPAVANQPQTIYLTEYPTNVSQVRVGSLSGCSNTTSCQGDYLIGDDPMFDAATGKEVGTILFECFLVDPASGLFHCPGITIDLAGRGQIVFTEKFDGSSQTSPITGGTGEFLGATGTVTSQLPPSGDGDFMITITK